MFFDALQEIMQKCASLLELRAEQLIASDKLSYVLDNKIWHGCATVADIIKQGTLSIGFIGIAETVEVLTGEKLHLDKDAYNLARKIVEFMKAFVDQQRLEKSRNFSLLATPGENISGRFCECDRQYFQHPILENGFYTNSYHVEVSSAVPLLTKLQLEGPFHKLCNGGAISYLEFAEAPINNIAGLHDAIQFAEANAVSYLGFNYPLDICKNCGKHGTFDACSRCNSTDIKRIRRVSGYLEDVDFFTTGKVREAAARKANT